MLTKKLTGTEIELFQFLLVKRELLEATHLAHNSELDQLLNPHTRKKIFSNEQYKSVELKEL